MLFQGRSLRKATGGRYTNTNPKKLHGKASRPTLTDIGQERRREKRTRGGNSKKFLLSTSQVNLFDPKKKKHVKAKLEVVKKSSANRNFTRRNILTKGTLIKTDKGMAKVTNRPGQEGIVNAILQEE